MERGRSDAESSQRSLIGSERRCRRATAGYVPRVLVIVESSSSPTIPNRLQSAPPESETEMFTAPHCLAGLVDLMALEVRCVTSSSFRLRLLMPDRTPMRLALELPVCNFGVG